MATLIADHQLNDFDEWFALFSANPPPAIGKWRLLRGSNDPNRVYVIVEVSGSEIDEIKNFIASDEMQETFKGVAAMSKRPIDFIWVNEVPFG